MPTVTVNSAGETASATYTVAPAQKTITLSPFTDQKSGLYRVGSFDGQGAICSIPAHTSTLGPTVAAIPAHSTNPYRAMRLGGTASAIAQAAEFANFVLTGTDQGHNYGGIQFLYGRALYFHDATITGMPGDASGPPGETFGAEFLHIDDSKIEAVTIDGRRTADSKIVGATCLGYTGGNNATLAGLTLTNSWCAFALAMYQNTGTVKIDNCKFINSRKALNFEQFNVTSATLTACDFRGTQSPFIAQISSIMRAPQVTFIDPIVDAYPVKVRTFPDEAGTRVDDNLIRCTIGGKDVTNDPSKFLIVHSG